MKIFNVIWLNNDLEPAVESFYKFEDAVRSVHLDMLNYEKRHGFYHSVWNRTENHLFARMEDVFEVEVIETKIK